MPKEHAAYRELAKLRDELAGESHDPKIYREAFLQACKQRPDLTQVAVGFDGRPVLDYPEVAAGVPPIVRAVDRLICSK